MIIATKFVRKSTDDHHQIWKLPKAIQIHITHSGGTNEAAIATHARPSTIFLYQRAKNPTAPDAIAIQRSTKVG